MKDSVYETLNVSLRYDAPHIPSNIQPIVLESTVGH